MALAVNRTKTKNRIKIALTVSLLFVGVIGYAIYWAFFDMNRLPIGEYVTEQTSPDGTFTVKAYVSGTSLSADAVRAELVFNARDGKTKNIYWGYRESTAEIEWLDNQTVVINGQKLEVPNDTFDWRRE